MANEVILRLISEKLDSIDMDSNSIVVLKGIPLQTVDSKVTKIELSKAIENKMQYFMSIYGSRNYISYEEFLVLADFIVAQYKEIYILNNNIYMEQYPIEDCFSPDIREGLLNHYSESEQEEDDDSMIGDIEEFVAIFEGIREFNGYLMGAYSTTQVLSSNKIINVNLFDYEKCSINYSDDSTADYIDIVEESDYIDFVKLLFAEPDEICVRTTNYIGDVNRLRNHLELIAYYWREYTEVYYANVQVVDDEFEHRDEYNSILKKYWGYDSFRKLSVYDMNKLEQGEKDVIDVSQEQVISNLVQQVENCMNDDDFRDVFVTAPTGAGKSVMFQVPAIYLAEKYNLLTIVVSPLIGLMNDQVKNLELKNYRCAKTINSDISPIIKQDIIGKVAASQYHILYLSPETLLSRSDVEQLIGDRTIGMIVIDEAHIVTT